MFNWFKKLHIIGDSGSINGAWIMTLWTSIMVVEYILACIIPEILEMLKAVGSQQVTAYSVAIGAFMAYRGAKRISNGHTTVNNNAAD